MPFIERIVKKTIDRHINRGKSILLLGPRQTGKTTLIKERVTPDAMLSFAKPEDRLMYEKDLLLFSKKLQTLKRHHRHIPLVFVDEIQKIPFLMDTVQYFIDEKKAQFILSGSSARQLKHGKDINLLPGRTILLHMTPFLYHEIKDQNIPLEDLINNGTLPSVIAEPQKDDQEAELKSYVTTYLQDEIRTEAVVRNVGNFARFLQLAAGESGKTTNLSKLSQELGVASNTILNYYQILEDCMIAHRIDPMLASSSKRRLIRSSKYLFFDLGIRRAAAEEGWTQSPRQLGELFEQYVGLELIHLQQSLQKFYRLRYWRDRAGPEVDFVIDYGKVYTPIEVKYTERPNQNDAKHLIKFMKEYEVPHGYIICRIPERITLLDEPNITAIPWQELHDLVLEITQH